MTYGRDAKHCTSAALWPQVSWWTKNKKAAQYANSQRLSQGLLSGTLNNKITLKHLLWNFDLLPHSNLGNLFLTSRKQGPVDVGSIMLVILLVVCVSSPFCSSHGVPLRNKIQLILEEEMPEEKLSVAKGRRGESRVQNQ